jgi:hypothetical protein
MACGVFRRAGGEFQSIYKTNYGNYNQPKLNAKFGGQICDWRSGKPHAETYQ